MTVLAVVAADDSLTMPARQLAAELNLPFNTHPTGEDVLLLRLAADGLSLCDPTSGAALRCDLATGRAGYRRRHGGGVRQALARAVGVRGGVRPSVLDATAGLGRDGFELAGLGCRVTLLERMPVVHALLRDGLARAQPLAADTCGRISLRLADAHNVLTDLARGDTDLRPDVVYLDPMHPPRDKAALVRKEMRLLRGAVGHDTDAGALLGPALAAACLRVVVKRPSRAEALGDRAPDWSVTGRTTRYDVYRAASPGMV